MNQFPERNQHSLFFPAEFQVILKVHSVTKTREGERGEGKGEGEAET